jgi:ABC-2 type transport system ATP-binding protein
MDLLHINLDQPAVYTICLQGRLDCNGSGKEVYDWFLGEPRCEFETGASGDTVTVLTGAVTDQAALYGLLAHIRDLGLVLLLVDCLTARGARPVWSFSLCNYFFSAGVISEKSTFLLFGGFMSDDKKAIQVQALHKDFGEVYAVKGVDLDVPAGEVFSLLGPNGAGKSTIISMLSCLIQPTKGDALVMGHSIIREPHKVKEVIGVVPQDIALYPDLSARENLEFWGKMYGLRGAQLRKRVEAVLELVGLREHAKGRIERFSGGMKRRINIGAALLHNPQVLILDEPTVGIDPQSRRSILDGVKEFNRQGMTVLYTSHYMEEVAELSHHIAIMDHGQVIAYGTHDELVKIVGQFDRLDLVINGQEESVVECWKTVAGVESVTAEKGIITALVKDSNLVLPDLFEVATRMGARITSVSIQEPNLETVFIHLTGRALRDGA